MAEGVFMDPGTRVWAGAGLLTAVVWSCLTVPTAHAQDTRVSGGVTFRIASGTFGGDQTTTILYAPAVLRLDTGRFEFAGFFPYVSIRDGAGALSDGGWLPMQGAVSGAPGVGMSMSGGMMGGTTSPAVSSPSGGLTLSQGAVRTSPSGLGDLVGAAGYRVVDNLLTGVQVVVSARIKVPTASVSHGLGTGRTDVGGAAIVRKRFGSGWLYGEVGYIVLGKPAGADLQNAVTWGLGGGKRLTSRVFLLSSAFGNSAVLPGYAAPAEVGVGLGVRLADHLYLNTIPSVGLSHASPRYAVTVGVSTDLWRR
jgi:hypothetical protein